jgi:hypothetical protein
MPPEATAASKHRCGQAEAEETDENERDNGPEDEEGG